jgi:guanyl-specific ribonuclease Sa
MRAIRLLMVLALLALAFYVSQQGRQGANQGPRPDEPKERYVVKDVVVRVEEDERIVTRRGEVDVSNTVARIRAGRRIDRWEHDGDPFGNHEKRLPVRPRGYYREWVHPTPEATGPGPQRIISGEDGDLWYTPDHYETFRKLEPAKK